MKKLQQTLLVGINLALILGGAYWVYSQTNKNDDNQMLSELIKEMKSVRSDLSALKDNDKKLSRLESEFAKLKAGKNQQSNQVNAKNNSLASDNVEEDAIKHEEFNPTEIAKQQEAEQAKTLDKINNTFLAEASDQAWSPEATQVVKSFFEGETGAQINLLDFECRKTLCKVEITNPQNPNVNDKLMLSFPTYVSKVLSQASFFYANNEDGTSNVIIYLVRNGFDFPRT